MDTLDLGHQWVAKLSYALPSSSARIRTRLAWRLAALGIHTDDSLRQLTDVELTSFVGGSSKLAEMRDQYLNHLDNEADAETSSKRALRTPLLLATSPLPYRQGFKR